MEVDEKIVIGVMEMERNAVPHVLVKVLNLMVQVVHDVMA
jgi:hypothetical protein